LSIDGTGGGKRLSMDGTGGGSKGGPGFSSVKTSKNELNGAPWSSRGRISVGGPGGFGFSSGGFGHGGFGHRLSTDGTGGRYSDCEALPPD
jgi:hypothetical protein